ncbi:hypothetical protein LCGC14_1626340 [marine sediment metagenome]|uniref:Uncharacterized protein n=1 Tax=marine sediment metagenome TaxID=412755 RepID=A0A0F9I481_9ZZZZ
MLNSNMILTCFVMWMLVSTGCAFSGSVRQQYSDTNEGFITAVTFLNEAREANKFNDEEWVEIVALIEIGDRLLHDYDVSTQIGIDDPALLTRIKQVLIGLQSFLTKV